MLGCTPLKQFTACKANEPEEGECWRYVVGNKLIASVMPGLGREIWQRPTHFLRMFHTRTRIFTPPLIHLALPPDWLNASTLDKEGQRAH